ESTWRWRHRVGDRYHHRFWGPLVRWAARFKASAGNEHVRFGPVRTEVPAGEDVLLRAHWSPRFLAQSPDLRAHAEIFAAHAPKNSDALMRIDLKAIATRPTVQEGRAANLKPGEYRVELKAENADLGEPISAELFVTEPGTTELS